MKNRSRIIELARLGVRPARIAELLGYRPSTVYSELSAARRWGQLPPLVPMRKKVIVRVTDDQHDRLTEAAERLGLSVPEMMRLAVEDWLVRAEGGVR